jgi:prevent-host-death family protein
MNAQWSLHDAKNKFSAVVEAARQGRPQLVTRRGTAAVVVLAAEEYQRLMDLEAMQAPSFTEHLLAIPKQDPPSDSGDFERLDVALRDIDL